MPIHEYRCQSCGKRTSILFRTLSSVDHARVVCKFCGGKKLDRLVSRVRVMRGEGGESLGPEGDVDPSLLDGIDGLDENDPRALGRFMRKMADETGEDLGPEFNEVIGRLEKGEDPDKIERAMGDVFGDAPDGADDGDTPPDAPAEPAPAQTAKRKPRAKKAAARKAPAKRTAKKA
jgi:putative FmdB family regulatory protein